MFWKFLFGWTIVGAILEFSMGFLAGAICEKLIRTTVVADESMVETICNDILNAFNILHGKWCAPIYKVFPGVVGTAIVLAWTAIVWPLDLPLSARDFKEAYNRITQAFINGVNKAS